MIKISNVQQADLPAVVAIERAGFSPAEAGTPAAFQDRLNKLPDTFLVAKDGDRVVGFIVGPAVDTRVIDDQMYETAPPNLPTGGYQLVLSLAVARLPGKGRWQQALGRPGAGSPDKQAGGNCARLPGQKRSLLRTQRFLPGGGVTF